MEKAQERQQKAYKKRIKKGTKRFKVLPGMVVLKKDERKRGRPGRTMDPDWPTQYRLINFKSSWGERVEKSNASCLLITTHLL